ncbi:MAG: hypothetical protein ACFFDC_17975 [Promethearchaeota archaeon]
MNTQRFQKMLSWRPFSFNNDLNEIRDFLLDVYRESSVLHYLIPTKIENHKYGPCGTSYTKKDDEDITIWKLKEKGANSNIIAVCHRGPARNYHIEIQPQYKYLERELFLTLEKIEQDENPDLKGELRLIHYNVATDPVRKTTLEELHYKNLGLHEFNYIRPKESPIPSYILPQGFTIRHIEGKNDFSAYIDVVGSVLPHCEENMSIEKLIFMSEAEFYHPDLNLIVETADGEFVAFCTFRFDPRTKIAELELLGVHPKYAQLQLKTALVCEGLERLIKYQPNMVCVVESDIYDENNLIYEATGFSIKVPMNMWAKIL